MEVETGADYKNTEMGLIPRDWDVRRVKSLVVEGPRNGYSGRTGQHARGTATLSLSATSSGRFVLNDDTVKRLEEEIPPGSDLFLQPGDVLVQRSNTSELVGTAALYPGSDFNLIYPDLMSRLRFRERITAEWFCGYANSGRGRQYFQQVAAGSSGSMPKISGAAIREMPIPIPPLPEQRAITDALSDVDALIKRLGALIAKKRAIKTATMQRLLTGDQHLPGFSAPWTTKLLGDVFDLLRTANNSRKDLADHGDVAYIHYGDVHTFPKSHLDFQHDSLPFIDAAKVQNATPLQNGDLVMVNASEDYEGVGKSIEISGLNGQHAVAGLHTFLLRGNGAFLADGFKGYMQHMPMLQEALHRIATGTSVYGISKTKIKDVELRLPPVNEQRAIANILSNMDAEIEALQARRDKTQAIKQGMMQELLTGRTRLV